MPVLRNADIQELRRKLIALPNTIPAAYSNNFPDPNSTQDFRTDVDCNRIQRCLDRLSGNLYDHYATVGPNDPQYATVRTMFTSIEKLGMFIRDLEVKAVIDDSNSLNTIASNKIHAIAERMLSRIKKGLYPRTFSDRVIVGLLWLESVGKAGLIVGMAEQEAGELKVTPEWEGDIRFLVAKWLKKVLRIELDKRS